MSNTILSRIHPRLHPRPNSPLRSFGGGGLALNVSVDAALSRLLALVNVFEDALVCVRVRDSPFQLAAWWAALVTMSGLVVGSRRRRCRYEPGVVKQEAVPSPLLHYVVVGGGVGGVSCVQNLIALAKRDTLPLTVTLISPHGMIKRLVEKRQFTAHLKEYEVSYEKLTSLSSDIVRVVQDRVVSVSHSEKRLVVSSGETIFFDKLCICTGASPSLICSASKFCVGIRDDVSVERVARALSSSRRILVVGNGGIALEVIDALKDTGLEIVWAVKDLYIGNTFYDASASDFFFPSLFQSDVASTSRITPDYDFSKTTSDGSAAAAWPWTEVGINHGAPSPTSTKQARDWGYALGPRWMEAFAESEIAAPATGHAASGNVQLELGATVLKLAENGDKEPGQWNVHAWLSNDKVYGCDLIISATGVQPEVRFLVDKCSDCPLALDPNDGGIQINKLMETNLSGIFAAGDVASVTWVTPQDHVDAEGARITSHWFQMRLWDQAEQAGRHAALSMCALRDELSASMSFELFTHVTSCFGFKVVLLGLFNGQTLGSSYEMVLKERALARPQRAGEAGDELRNPMEVLIRATPGQEYIKVVVVHGKVVGAMLIGDTDLEETFENLILSQIDVTGMNLLDPDLDLEDYFD